VIEGAPYLRLLVLRQLLHLVCGRRRACTFRNRFYGWRIVVRERLILWDHLAVCRSSHRALVYYPSRALNRTEALLNSLLFTIPTDTFIFLIYQRAAISLYIFRH
jgi:hypothetical protein